MKSAEMDQKSFRTSSASGNESWNSGLVENLLILQGSLDDFPLYLVDSVSRWMSSAPDLLCKVVLFHLRPGTVCSSPLSTNITSFALSPLSIDFRCVHLFQVLKVHNQYVSFPDSPRVQYINRGIFLGALSFQIDGFLTDPSWIWDDIPPMNQIEWLVLWMVHQIAFSYSVFLSDKRSLNISKIAVAFHGIRPPNFHPDLIATIPQMALFFNSAYYTLSNSHLFLNGEGLTCHDPTRGLHRLSQIPWNCQCKWLLVSWSAPRTFASCLSVSCEVFVLARIRLNPLSS